MGRAICSAKVLQDIHLEIKRGEVVIMHLALQAQEKPRC